MNFDMAMFHQAFFEEATDLLADFENLLLHLEERPDDTELLNGIFRCAHSIKGGSASFGFGDIARFTHSLETLLDRMRNGEIRFTKGLGNLLLACRDQLSALVLKARGEQADAPDSQPCIDRIETVLNGSETPVETQEPAETGAVSACEEKQAWGIWSQVRSFHLRLVPGESVLRQGTDILSLLNQLTKAVEVTEIHCDLSRLPALAELDPETCCLGWDIHFRTDWDEARLLEIFEFIAGESEIVLTELAVALTPEPSVAEPSAPPLELPVTAAVTPFVEEILTERRQTTAAAPTAPAKTEAQTLRVSTDKVDKLINLVGELVINQSMLNEVIQDFNMGKLPRLCEAVAEMERASRELQERVMAVRMLPIKHAFGRFPRLIHDLASACGKKIELKTSGEETELDKSVIEAIGDPLTHLVRNAADHGLELPDERRAAGKPETGTITLHAFHEGGNIVIEVTDDGRGLNRERILRKATERGLLTENDSVPADEILYNFIFHPGFSTAAAVTDLSGRGVGMDIVKQAVVSLGGTITLNSTPGAGTRFRIRLPLTMAILEGLSLSVGQEVYILPLTSIVESIRPKAGEVRVVAGATEVALVRGEVLPILRVHQVFGVETFVTDPTQGVLVIVENDDRKVALLVDELIGQSQVVIKSLETNYRKVDGIAGATILGDGRVALIVDVPGLLRNTRASLTFAA